MLLGSLNPDLWIWIFGERVVRERDPFLDFNPVGHKRRSRLNEVKCTVLHLVHKSIKIERSMHYGFY